MEERPDPRVFFAAERTLLAWIRTGLTVSGLGFVVARFGFYLDIIMPPPGVHHSHLGATIIGVGLVLFGSVAVGISAWNYSRFFRQLQPNEKPASYGLTWSIWFAAMLSIIGFVLAGYLLLRAR